MRYGAQGRSKEEDEDDEMNPPSQIRMDTLILQALAETGHKCRRRLFTPSQTLTDPLESIPIRQIDKLLEQQPTACLAQASVTRPRANRDLHATLVDIFEAGVEHALFLVFEGREGACADGRIGQGGSEMHVAPLVEHVRVVDAVVVAGEEERELLLLVVAARLEGATQYISSGSCRMHEPEVLTYSKI